MLYRYFVFVCLLTSFCLSAMDSYLSKVILPPEQGSQPYFPSLYSLSVIAVARSLVAEQSDVEEALSLAELIDAGQWSHLKQKDDVLRVLRRDILLDLVESNLESSEIKTLEHEETHRGNRCVQTMALSPDGTRLAVATSSLTIWDVSDHTHLKKLYVLELPVSWAKDGGMQWASDGNRLLLYMQGNIFCWDTASWELVYRYDLRQNWNGFREINVAAAFSSDGRFFLLRRVGPVTPRDELPIQVRSMAMARLYLQGVLIDLSELEAFMEQRNAAQAGGKVEIPHTVISRHMSCWREGPSFLGNELAVAFSPNNKYAATAGTDTTIQLCDLEALPTISSRVFTHNGLVCTMAFSPDSSMLVTVAKEAVFRNDVIERYSTLHKYVLYLWDVTKGTSQILEHFPIDRYCARYIDLDYPVDINFDGRFIVFQSMKNYDCHRQRLLFDLDKKRWISIPDGERPNRDFPDCSTLFSNDLAYLFMAKGRRGNSVKVRPLLGLAQRYSLTEIVLLAQLKADRVPDRFLNEALVLREKLTGRIK